ncbi:MAG: deoxyribose-phosphate aldolase [Firmicutes bacterium HGW-Firmicutes-7]|nr:MAG: deoxyribose-phosphate aldolase [Firmicutes bacterium HGW-Firmicutes-7]
MKIGNIELNRESLAQMMDYSALNPDVTEEEIIRDCKVAKEYNFKGFHVNPVWVSTVARELEGTRIETGLVISFPFGTNPTNIKVEEAKDAVKVMDGRPAVIDMVTNVGKLKGKDYEYYKNDIAEVAKIAHAGGYECKAILEVAFLTDDEIIKACELAAEAGADWVKTSTGRHGGPTLEQVILMRKHSPKHVKVKVAGTGAFWTPMVTLGCLMAGAERIGTRRAPWIVDELSKVLPEML